MCGKIDSEKSYKTSTKIRTIFSL